MSLETAKKYLESKGFSDRIRLFDVSSATVELAAKALNTQPAHIAKSLTFMLEDGPIMILCAGDRKVDNAKYKGYFHKKAAMLTREQVSELIGHEVGGVCPFGIKPGVRVFLDESLKQYEKVFPACGNASSAVECTPAELEGLLENVSWVDVCKCTEAGQ